MILLSPQDAALRAADEQVSVLLSLYRNPDWFENADLAPGFVAARVQSLTEMQEALRSELDNRKLLPKEQDPEVSHWHFFIDRVRGLLENQPLAMPLDEEQRLLELCNELLAGDGSDKAAALKQGRNDLLEATEELRGDQQA